MLTRLLLESLPFTSPFLRAYSRAESFARLPGWFAYNPHDPQCYALRLAELDAAEPAAGQRRSEVSAALLLQQQGWAADASAQANALLIAQGGVYAVVTGQQAGVLGGPLYTQLKALSAVKLAREMEAQLPGRRFVPIFLIASGDHDYEEIRKTWLLGGDGALTELALPPEDAASAGLVARFRDPGGALSDLAAQAAQALPGGEFRDEVAQALREDWSASGPGALVQGFARWLARLTAGTGLVILDPLDPALLPSGAALLELAITHAAEAIATLEQRNAEIREAGFAVQVDNHPGDTHLFLLDGAGRRRKLLYREGRFETADGSESYGANELLAIARHEPRRFVFGAMLLPLYQNLIVPPVAFIGGGAELAYRAQATALFDLHAPACHGLRMAPALHRATATLLPQKSAALLDELGLELPDLMVPPQELAGRAAKAQRPEEIEAALREYYEQSSAAEARLRELAVGLDPSLGETFETLRGNFERHLEKLEKKITASLKQKGEALMRRVALLSAQAWPRLGPQERVLSLLSFLPRYGFGLGATLLEQLSVPGWEHQLIVL